MSDCGVLLAPFHDFGAGDNVAEGVEEAEGEVWQGWGHRRGLAPSRD